MSALLEVKSLSRHFGGLQALADVDLRIDPGHIVAIIGPNGAGKSTLFNVLTGLLAPTSGRVLFRGPDITGWPTHRIIQSGIGRTFQNNRLFARLSAMENIMVGGYIRAKAGFLASLLGLPGFRREEADLRERSLALLVKLGLADIADAPVGAPLRPAPSCRTNSRSSARSENPVA